MFTENIHAEKFIWEVLVFLKCFILIHVRVQNWNCSLKIKDLLIIRFYNPFNVYLKSL